MYYPTNPLMAIAEKYQLSFDEVHRVTQGDHHVTYEQTRRFCIKDVVIVLYRMASGNYEAVHYRAS